MARFLCPISDRIDGVYCHNSLVIVSVKCMKKTSPVAVDEHLTHAHDNIFLTSGLLTSYFVLFSFMLFMYFILCFLNDGPLVAGRYRIFRKYSDSAQDENPP